MTISIDTAFGIHPSAMKLRAHRAGILAANMANSDTPGYKARDIDFRAVLSSASDEIGKLAAVRTHGRHLGNESGPFGAVETAYRLPNHPSLDGNTVDADLERAAYLDNAMRYQASLNFLEGRLKGLILAIKGQ